MRRKRRFLGLLLVRAHIRRRPVRIMNRYVVTLLLCAVSACTVPVPIPKETPYPGSGFGRIESRGQSFASPVTVDEKGRPITLRVPVVGVGLIETNSSVVQYRGSFHYQIRAQDGTLHILANESEFQVGDCVRFSGYADGPSRTHWSRGRTTLERSNDCDW